MGTRELDFRDFSRVEVKYAIQVEIEPPDSYHVSLFVENFDARDVTFQQEADRLTIGRRRSSIKSWFAGPLARIKVKIGMPGLAELILSGASQGAVSGFASESSLNLALSGASTLSLSGISTGEIRLEISGASRLKGQVNTPTLQLRLKGASTAELSGEAKQLTVDASGASRFELGMLNAGDGEIKAQGASSGIVKLDGRLNARLGGASRLLYTGKPALGSISVSGASTISETH